MHIAPHPAQAADSEPQGQSASFLRRGLEYIPAAADAALASFPLFLAYQQIHPEVVAALDFSLKENIENFSDLKQIVESTEAMSPEAYAGWFSRLEGYVGEEIAANALEASGFEVLAAETANNPGWDLLVDGQEYNVKVGKGIGHIMEHFDKYPDIDVITSPDLAAELPAELQDKVIPLTELDHEHLTSKITETLEGVEGVDFDVEIPVITFLVSGWRELKLNYKGYTDLLTSLKNIGLDVAGTGIGGTIGGKIGAAIGTFIAPGVGTITGAAIGALIGGISGRMFTNSIKTMAFREAVEDYQRAVDESQRQIEEKHASFRESMANLISNVNDELQDRVRSIEHTHRQDLYLAKNDYETACRAFALAVPEALAESERRLVDEQKEVLQMMKRSGLFRRTFWPAHHDLIYMAVKSWFRSRRRELSRLAAYLRRKSTRLSGGAAVQLIKQHLDKKVIPNPRLEEAVDRLLSEQKQALERCETARSLATEEIKMAYTQSQNRIKRAMTAGLQEMARLLQEMNRRIAPLKERVVLEGRKLGYNL
ncbi:MAG TPA: hypothetical protein GXX29_02740 [Firmicutes bacterium]|nr:hypothetical protein [Bacillota bacterium]